MSQTRFTGLRLIGDSTLTALNTELPAMLSDSTRRGILLYERDNPSIDVQLCSSFNEARPFSLTISWFWDDGTL